MIFIKIALNVKFHCYTFYFNLHCLSFFLDEAFFSWDGLLDFPTLTCRCCAPDKQSCKRGLPRCIVPGNQKKIFMCVISALFNKNYTHTHFPQRLLKIILSYSRIFNFSIFIFNLINKRIFLYLKRKIFIFYARIKLKITSIIRARTFVLDTT